MIEFGLCMRVLLVMSLSYIGILLVRTYQIPCLARTASCRTNVEIEDTVGVQLDLVLLQHAIIQPLVQPLLAFLARGPLEQHDLHTCSHWVQSNTQTLKHSAFSFAVINNSG